MHHAMATIGPGTMPCICTTLRKAARAVSRLYDDAIVDAGMSTAQFAVLRNIDRAGELPLSRLAEMLVMERTSLYRMLAPLTRQDWVAIAASPHGRAKIARLTDAGRAAMAGATAHWSRVQADFVESLGQREWAALADALQDIAARASDRLETAA
jgi:DNA-binding MarR family transcriptional regulator